LRRGADGPDVPMRLHICSRSGLARGEVGRLPADEAEELPVPCGTRPFRRPALDMIALFLRTAAASALSVPRAHRAHLDEELPRDIAASSPSLPR